MPERVWIYLDLPLTITVEGPLHVGTGYDRGLIHRTVVRERLVIGKHARDRKKENVAHHVYIPGSSLKGKVRNTCEDLARLAGLKLCSAPQPLTMCGRDRDGYCLVCRVFGAPGENIPEGRELYWQDAHLTAQSRKEVSVEGQPWGQTTERTQVQLSRARGMAAEDRLYTSEFAAPGLTFAGRVSGWLEVTPCSADCGYYEVNLLLAGLRMVKMLGGGRSRGSGRCQIALPDKVSLRVEGKDEPESYAVTNLLAAAASLGLFTEEEGGGDGRA